jgi:hypothetical protein
VNTRLFGRAFEGVVGSDFNDPTNERLIYLSAAGLAVVGLLLLIGTILWWRRGRQEHPVLAPLEVMSTRSWEKAPESDRRRRLDQVRAVGAAAGVVEDEVVRSEPVDLQALVRSVPQAFDDLRESGEVAVVDEPVAEEAVSEEAVVEEAAVEEAAVEEAAVEEVAVDEPVVEEVAAEEPVAEEPVVEEAEAEADIEAEQGVEEEMEPVAVETPSEAPESAPTDATSASTERPSEVVEVAAGGPNDSSE